MTLTDREQEILDLIRQGLSSKHIAVRLNLSFHTVMTHRKNMLLRSGAKNAAHLVDLINQQKSRYA